MDNKKTEQLFSFLMQSKNNRLIAVDEYKNLNQTNEVERNAIESVPESLIWDMEMDTDTDMDLNLAMDHGQNGSVKRLNENIPFQDEQPLSKRRAMTMNIADSMAQQFGNIQNPRLNQYSEVERMVDPLGNFPNSRSYQYPEVKRMRLALSADQRTQIEQLRGELTLEQQLNVLNIINPYFQRKSIIITQYIELSTFVVINYIPEDRRRIFLFCPHPDVKPHQLHESITQVIDRLVSGQKYLVYGHYIKSERRDNDFCYVLAIALCRAMDQEITLFQLGLGYGGDTQHIRNVIVNLLLNDELPLGDITGNVWRL